MRPLASRRDRAVQECASLPCCAPAAKPLPFPSLAGLGGKATLAIFAEANRLRLSRQSLHPSCVTASLRTHAKLCG